jgi:hypothetical protein
MGPCRDGREDEGGEQDDTRRDTRGASERREKEGASRWNQTNGLIRKARTEDLSVTTP